MPEATPGVSNNGVKTDLIGSPIVPDSRLLMSGTAGPLLAFDAAEKERQWTLGSRGARVVPAVGNGTVYVSRIIRPYPSASAPDLRASIQAIGPASGSVRWSYGVGVASKRKLAAPLFADGTLYHATDATVVALPPE